MALSDVLTKLKNQRTAIVTAINGKGGTLGADATLADCATAIGNISGGGSSFYKCSALVAASEGGVQGQTISFHGVCQMDGMTPETVDLSFTMEDIAKTGWERTWLSSDGTLRLQAKVYLGQTPGSDVDDSARTWFITSASNSATNVWEADNQGGADGPANPWGMSTMMYDENGMDYNLTWTVSEASEATTASWSGYKATQGDDGKYSFADTATTGLSYDGGFTPQVGIIYTQDAKVKIAQLMEATAAIPQDGLILHMPFNGSSEVKVGTLVSSQGNITFGEEAGQKYGVFDGSTAFSLKTILGDETTDTCTVICYAKGAFSSSQTDYGYVFWTQAYPGGGSSSWGNGVYLTNSGNFAGYNNISCTRNAWNFFCIRRTSYTNYKIQINSNVYTGTWGNQNLGAGNFIGSAGNDTYYWIGNIFDCAVYNRILTDEEVTALYQRVVPLQS